MMHLTDDFGMANAGPSTSYTPDQEDVLRTMADDIDEERLDHDAEMESLMSRQETGTILPRDL